MTIRKGSAGTKDPAAANWDRIFGRGDGGTPRNAGVREQAGRTEGQPSTGDAETAHQLPSPTPAELDPEAGA